MVAVGKLEGQKAAYLIFSSHCCSMLQQLSLSSPDFPVSVGATVCFNDCCCLPLHSPLLVPLHLLLLSLVFRSTPAASNTSRRWPPQPLSPKGAVVRDRNTTGAGEFKCTHGHMLDTRPLQMPQHQQQKPARSVTQRLGRRFNDQTGQVDHLVGLQMFSYLNPPGLLEGLVLGSTGLMGRSGSVFKTLIYTHKTYKK